MTFIGNGTKKNAARIVLNIFNNNKKKNINHSVLKEQIREFKRWQRKKEQSFKQVNKLQYSDSLILTISSNKHAKFMISVGVFDVYLFVEWITYGTIIGMSKKSMLKWFQ